MTAQDSGAKTPEEATNFLYPFIDSEEHDPQALLVDLAQSAQAKAAESTALRRSTLAASGELVESAGAELARRFAAGGRLFTFGNGGSSTDSATLAALFARPPVGDPLPAWCLTADQAILTALGNDVGFELVFARQLIARAKAGDIAVALSTSGSSADLTVALREAKRRGMYTIGFAGYDGGAFATSPDVDTCFIVRSQSVHRIQEAQALLGYQLWSSVHEKGAVVA
ncbi:phosphoheptose isomerase [Mycolicibacterium chitae]|uniref:SIS domain-containing protein n=2 Tax=Mycobacteriaceae TaxID=1762 RepID=A0ABM9MG01_9MYCO|nr:MULTISPECIES: SIS domain-containing protein [Mycolicibacterium]MCV7105454.1 SIS domain-containing protein [Mycolicibacterium chitae]BBZ05270.1 phosphoheptose isomerase [Mycolicibacterium chitae]CAJ1584295.1 SIS domain-containing protein [Mycolicibacterium sp. MU0050]VEG48889.1 putative sugar phosphate isomerase [Mycolicibacterium chitae]